MGRGLGSYYPGGARRQRDLRACDSETLSSSPSGWVSKSLSVSSLICFTDEESEIQSQVQGYTPRQEDCEHRAAQATSESPCPGFTAVRRCPDEKHLTGEQVAGLRVTWNSRLPSIVVGGGGAEVVGT